ncbi:SDR family oxidoreductase [Mucilaginibacter agri]|uniref:NAD-dependent epimerase/dehydratase family protein n=1 Tax=Mucilaginibacter agri TaxID=2695265 RepID=A0A965ZGD0_9SPHI|nr:SDR family oxidoreductase [Mucilaginibacter agri]NCD70549.1 NAD-dependent epimerase/dehydratase family protein [Mucilaginibacter agri]
MYNKAYHTKNLTQFSFLVTGGAGFIGSNIVEYLLKYNAKKVRVVDNFSTGLRQNIEQFLTNPSFELIEGDIRDLEICRLALEGIDYVSHQAALGSVPRSINDPITTNEVNISGFLNMLVAARDAGVKRFVYAASSSTYGDHPDLPKVEDKIGNPLSPYAITKYVNELYALVFSRTYDFHSVGLRYFNVFGPRQNPNGAYAAVIPLFVKSALNKKAALINGDGKTSRDFTFVENAVQANIKALFIEDIVKSEVINIAYGESTTLNELWEEICKLCQINIDPIYNTERKGDVKHSLADISRAALLIGYNPEFSALQGLENVVKWYTEQNSFKRTEV